MAAVLTAMSDQINKERHHLILARISTERLLKTDEVAAPVAWLCSAASSFATGGMRVVRRPRHALTRHHTGDFCGTQDVAACTDDIDGDAGRSEGHVGHIAPELDSRRFQRQARSWRCLTWEHLAAMILRRMKGISRDIRGQLQSHGLTGLQARHYDGHEYVAEKRHALEVLCACLESRARVAAAARLKDNARDRRARLG